MLNIILSIIPALICITVHEFSHGFVACKLGDNTAKNMGRLTLNPLKHIDIFGLIMMAVFKFGWAKPVPVNMFNFKNPKKGMALTALAGPASNILLSCAALLIYGFLFVPLNKLGVAGYVISEILYLTAYINIALAVLNMIPIPPLDGSKILLAFLPDQTYYKLMRYEQYGMVIFFIIVVSGVLSGHLSTAVRFVFNLLLNLADLTYGLYFIIF